MKKIIFFIFVCFFSTYSLAAINVDRTRIIYDADKGGGVSLVIDNNDTTSPFLAQAWIEDTQGVKIKEPVVALPMLQRVEAGQKKQVRISLIGKENVLPQDRESLFYFNILGIPPKSTEDNVGQLFS